MENNKGQAVKRNGKTVNAAQERPQEDRVQMERTNINDINKRNAEQKKQEQKSSYTVAGVVVLLIIFIIVVVYFFG